ncbi:hypothetical protein GPL15_00195 [Clostridium sp. MCC353]|uniref:hypothetical protein n=1 Tax=Clostridium sp. MCC353 TaxID=2592646 RepID=UPI001C039D98|nr:hypothetical protein [Clostridium sp. MCC353]MBT9774928.1 hypothetical protein [Clostridium sp. MCC353]
MNTKKRIFALIIMMLLSVFSFTACASEGDKNAAQLVSQQIEQIGNLTLDKANTIYDVQKAYANLTETQKKLVKNYEVLNDYITELEEIIIEEEIKNDPTNSIKREEMIGIWQEDDSSDVHRGYFYFSKEDYIYYIASKSQATQTDFTGDYILATSFSLEEYNRETKMKDGSFFCIPINRDINFAVSKVAGGEMTLDVSDSTCGGTYHKTGEKIDILPKQCLHSDCSKLAVTTGDSRYCDVHSNKCGECSCYIDEDAMFCLNCIVKALREIN